MDRLYSLHGLRFVWNEEKAAINLAKHGVSFEQASEVFLDPFLQIEDASVSGEARHAAIGFTFAKRLLYVVHIERTGDYIRLISARPASTGERFTYEDNG